MFMFHAESLLSPPYTKAPLVSACLRHKCNVSNMWHTMCDTPFSSSFYSSDIKVMWLSVGPCSAVSPFLAVHGQTCSVIGFWSLHHKRLELGFLQPRQTGKDTHQQGIILSDDFFFLNKQGSVPMRPWHLCSIMSSEEKECRLE